MLRITLAIAGSALLSTAGSAQMARTPVVVHSEAESAHFSSDGGDGGLVVGWQDVETGRLFVSTSDGRGLTWTPPVRVNEDETGAPKSGPVVAMLRDRVLVLWGDKRPDPSVWTLYYNVIDLETGELHGERRVDPYHAPESQNVTRFSVDVTRAGDTELIYVTSWIRPAGAYSPDRLVLSISEDCAETFQAPGVLVGPSESLAGFELTARGDELYVAWYEGRVSHDDVFFKRSDGRGAPGTFTSPQTLDASGPLSGDARGDLHVELHGDTVAVMWIECPEDSLDCFYEDLKVRTSHDGGYTFGDEVTLTEHLWGHMYTDLVIEPITGNLVASYNGFVKVSEDGGQTFEITKTYNGDDGRLMLSTTANPGSVVMGWWELVYESTWREFYGGVAEQRQDLFAAVSTDGGLSWSDLRVTVDGDGHTSLGAIRGDAYGNFVYLWPELTGDRVDLLAGGFRLQTLRPDFDPESATVAFELDRFHRATDPHVWVLLSLATGDVLLPDGRHLGLAFDPLLSVSLVLANAGALSATIAADGTGATPEVHLDLPPGMTPYAAAFGLDPLNATVGNITDVVKLHP